MVKDTNSIQKKSTAGRNSRLVVFIKILGFAGILAYFCASFYLYAMQASVDGVTNVQYFESDLPAHISMAFDGWGYSLTAVVYRLLGFFPGWKYTIPLFLALCTAGATLLTYFGLKSVLKNDVRAIGGALITSFTMPIHVAAIQAQRYIGYQSGSIWHNSTYNVMKILSVATLILYLKLASEMNEKFKTKELVWFAVMLALTTAAKTSFTLVFAPAAFILLIVDKTQKVSWKKVFSMAATVVPAILVMLLQEVILFGDSTGNGIEIDFGYTVYRRAAYPQITMILSALFPVLVFLFNIIPVARETVKSLGRREGLKHRAFWLSWIMWFIGALQLLFLKETGERADAGNFAWGYDLCLFVLFVVSLVYFIRNLRNDKFLFGSRVCRVIYGIVLGAVLLAHTYCGLYFFMCLLEGTTYFM